MLLQATIAEANIVSSPDPPSTLQEERGVWTLLSSLEKGLGTRLKQTPAVHTHKTCMTFTYSPCSLSQFNSNFIALIDLSLGGHGTSGGRQECQDVDCYTLPTTDVIDYPARACAKGLSNQFFLSVRPSVRPSVR